MVSKNFLLISSVLLIIPIAAFSRNQDYLFIFGTYDGVNYTIDSIEQRVIPTGSIIQPTGSYEVQLYRKNKLVSNSFFEIPEPGPKKIPFEGGFIEEEGRKQVIFTAIIPLLVSTDVSRARIQILKSGQILFEKELNEVPVTVLSVQENELITLENLETGDRSGYKNLITFSLTGVGIVLVGWYLWKRRNEKDEDTYIQ